MFVLTLWGTLGLQFQPVHFSIFAPSGYIIDAMREKSCLFTHIQRIISKQWIPMWSADVVQVFGCLGLCEQNQVLLVHLQYWATDLILLSNNWPKALLHLVLRSVSGDSSTSGQTRHIALVRAYQMCLLWPVIGFRGDSLWLHDYIYVNHYISVLLVKHA